MEILRLSLRQRKILHYIHNKENCVTSKELAEKMKVSSRTIRNDIHAMNDMMQAYDACIVSTQGKGFLLQAKDPDLIREITRVDNTFFTRTERLRYLSFRLCESDTPLNLYDLEEEVFVSRTALLSDLKLLRKKYSLEPPYIKILIHGDEVSLERDEEKIRSVLLHMFHEDWDYTIQKNAFYGSHYIDKDLLELLLQKTRRVLADADIRMDDASLSALQLLLAITHERVKQGYIYPARDAADEDFEPGTKQAVKELFALMRDQTGITYPVSEYVRIYEFIFRSRLANDRWPEEGMFVSSFPKSVREEVDRYLEDIRELFRVDFSEDPEFVAVLCAFFQRMISGNSMFSRYQDPLNIKKTLTAEFELAYLYQKQAPAFIGRCLLERELSSLALCFSGAIRQYLAIHPEKKLKAILFSHGNLAEAFSLKRRIMEAFSLYLNITEMAPLNFADFMNLTDTDLIFTTLRKKPWKYSSEKTVFVDDLPNAGFDADEMKIKMLSQKNIWPRPFCSLEELLKQAFWNGQEETRDNMHLISRMVSDYRAAGIAGKEHEEDILHRETISSFAIRSGLVFVHTLIPAEETKLSVVSLKHSIRWSDYKVNTVVMAMFRKEDISLLFLLKIQFCNKGIDPAILQRCRSKEELCSCLL